MTGLTDLIQAIQFECRHYSQPDPSTAPRWHPDLSLMFATVPDTLSPEDLCCIVGWSKPHLYDNLDAFLFYLPKLAKAYGERALPCADEFLAVLMYYRRNLTPTIRNLLGSVVLSAWLDFGGGANYVNESVFLVFWLEDTVPLESTFRMATTGEVPSEKDTWYLEQLAALFQQIHGSTAPLEVLWSRLWEVGDESNLRDAILLEREQKLLVFLDRVAWL